MQRLRDSFGRTFPYIRLSITDVCNFKCGYCLPNGYQIDKSDRKAVVEQLTKAMGGTMHSMDIVRGPYDFIVVNELTSFEDFAATKIVVEASGAVKNLTMLEAIDFTKATTKASEVVSGSYKAPGQ